MKIHSKVRAVVALLCSAVAISIGGAPVTAADPLDYIVHTEHVQVGPYPVDIGFTVWPLRAMQSLDFTFEPGGGIADKSGIVTEIAPDGTASPARLSRHPRNRAIWGLDVHSLDTSGDWTLRFQVDGPAGPGAGDLTVNVLEQPGPPLPLSWAIGLLPLALGLVFFAAVWLRTGLKSSPAPRG